MSSAAVLRKGLLGFCVALWLLTLLSPPVSAATMPGAVSVTTSVMGVCVIGRPALVFMPEPPTGLRWRASRTTLTLTCALGTAYRIRMNTRSASTDATLRRAGGAPALMGETQDRGPGEVLAREDRMATDISAGVALSSNTANTLDFSGQLPAAGELTGRDTDNLIITVAYGRCPRCCSRCRACCCYSPCPPARAPTVSASIPRTLS